ncbi:MAG: YihY/virulence factor BrkB family protein [Anaerolineae bacterium]|nr:YihY/virulence factor BrkB family protein [Anaerolineae bacterium]
MPIKGIFQLLRDSFAAWRDDNASRLAAALSYYTVFSIAPLLVIVIAVAGRVLGEEAVRGEIAAQIGSTVGPETAEFIQSLVANAREPASGTIAAIIGVITLFLGASGVFGQLQGALDTIWRVEPAPGRGIRGTIEDRFLGFAMVLAIGFLLMVALVASTAISVASSFLADRLPLPPGWLSVLDFVLSFALITVLFAIIFKVLPRVQLAWRDVWLGAAVTSFLFNIGKLLIGWYLGTTGAGSAFGAAGSLIVLLLWVYYSAQIFLLGAEFTKVYATRYGSHLVPEEDAIRFAIVTEDEARLAAVARTLPAEEVQLIPHAVTQGEPAPAPPPRAAGAGPGRAYQWAVAVAASFVAGLLVAARRR